MQHQHLPAAEWPGADADGRHTHALRDHVSKRGGDRLQHDRVRSRLVERLGVAYQPHRVARCLALHAETAQLVHRLRRQADVPHHGDTRFDETSHRLGHARTALEFHRAGARLLQDARRRTHRVLPAGLVAAERQIDDDVRALGAADHRLGVVDHLVEGDRERRVVSQHHHREAVADQDRRDLRLVHELRGRVVVRSDHRDWLATVAHSLQIGGADAPHRAPAGRGRARHRRTGVVE